MENLYHDLYSNLKKKLTKFIGICMTLCYLYFRHSFENLPEIKTCCIFSQFGAIANVNFEELTYDSHLNLNLFALDGCVNQNTLFSKIVKIFFP